MSSIKNVIVELCTKYIRIGNNPELVKQNTEPIENSLDLKVAKAEVSEKTEEKKPEILKEFVAEEKTKIDNPKNTDFINYFADIITSGYKRLKTKTEKAYSMMKIKQIPYLQL